MKNATKCNAVWRVIQQNQLDRETTSSTISEPKSHISINTPLDTPASRGDWTPLNEELYAETNGYATNGREEVSTVLLKRLSEMAMSQPQVSFDLLLYIGQVCTFCYFLLVEL